MQPSGRKREDRTIIVIYELLDGSDWHTTERWMDNGSEPETLKVKQCWMCMNPTTFEKTVCSCRLVHWTRHVRACVPCWSLTQSRAWASGRQEELARGILFSAQSHVGSAQVSVSHHTAHSWPGSSRDLLTSVDSATGKGVFIPALY